MIIVLSASLKIGHLEFTQVLSIKAVLPYSFVKMIFVGILKSGSSGRRIPCLFYAVIRQSFASQSL
jgi:hypothetical protein